MKLCLIIFIACGLSGCAVSGVPVRAGIAYNGLSASFDKNGLGFDLDLSGFAK